MRKTWPAVQVYVRDEYLDVATIIAMVLAAVEGGEDYPTNAVWPHAATFAKRVLPVYVRDKFCVYLLKVREQKIAMIAAATYKFEDNPRHVGESREECGTPVFTGPRDEAINVWVSYGRMHLSQ